MGVIVHVTFDLGKDIEIVKKNLIAKHQNLNKAVEITNIIEFDPILENEASEVDGDDDSDVQTLLSQHCKERKKPCKKKVKISPERKKQDQEALGLHSLDSAGIRTPVNLRKKKK